MNSFLPYHTSFILDKAHFSECFDQSVVRHGLKDYRKAAIIGAVGLMVMFAIATNQYVAFFIIALAAVEALSVYFKKTWWLWRQMISKAYDNKVELEINQQGVITTSFHINSELSWADITSVEQTDAGLLLHHAGGVNYLSNSYLSDEVIAYIAAK